MPKRCAFVVMLAISVVAGAGGCAANSRPSGGKAGTGGVEGVVIDATGTGVRGAVVSVLTSEVPPQELGSGSTDGAGRFLVENLAAGNGRVVRIEKPVRIPLRAVRSGVSITAGRVRDLGEIELKAGGG